MNVATQSGKYDGEFPQINKVFGIGLSRTGTMSLNDALEMLGYPSKHYPTNLSIFDSDEYNAGTDITVAIKYKDLDKKYPNSKFILTERNLTDWIESMKKHYARYPEKIENEFLLKTRMDTWGTKIFDPEKLISKYLSHNKEVKQYFKNRPKDFLILRITDGERWEKLCPFLNKDILNTSFPKRNTSIGLKKYK